MGFAIGLFPSPGAIQKASFSAIMGGRDSCSSVSKVSYSRFFPSISSSSDFSGIWASVKLGRNLDWDTCLYSYTPLQQFQEKWKSAYNDLIPWSFQVILFYFYIGNNRNLLIINDIFWSPDIHYRQVKLYYILIQI